MFYLHVNFIQLWTKDIKCMKIIICKGILIVSCISNLIRNKVVRIF